MDLYLECKANIYSSGPINLPLELYANYSKYPFKPCAFGFFFWKRKRNKSSVLLISVV